MLRENKIRDVEGCPVLDGSSVLMKLAEGMADLHRALGTRWSRGGGVPPATLGEIDAAYGVR